jgi:hypothetical protein
MANARALSASDGLWVSARVTFQQIDRILRAIATASVRRYYTVMPSSRMTRWTGEREAQHAAVYPPELKAERNRQAQARYRERHIGQRRTIARIANLLQRQSWDDRHFEQLGTLLHRIMGKAEIVKLRRALMPRKRATNDAG